MKRNRKPTGEAKLFREIWHERSHICFLTGWPLNAPEGSSIWYSYFAHILPKKDYPEYRLVKNNIALLHPMVHTLFDHPEIKKILKFEKKNKISFDTLFLLADYLRDLYIRETGKKRFQRKFVIEYRESKKK